jgi:hydrogenase expression/formation protein HypC
MCLGIPARVVEIYQADGLKMGKVDFGGVLREVCLEYVPEIQVGEYAIIHVGFAISRIDEEEAQKTFELLREIDLLADELPELADGDEAPS